MAKLTFTLVLSLVVGATANVFGSPIAAIVVLSVETCDKMVPTAEMVVSAAVLRELIRFCCGAMVAVVRLVARL